MLPTLEADLDVAAVSRKLRDGDPPLAVLRHLHEIEILIEGFVASWHSSVVSVQSRRWHRRRFEKELAITPLNDATELPCGDEFPVMGRDISLTGLSFVHREPLASRLVAVSFAFDDGSRGSVVTQLRWCRYSRDGIYQSGGRFVRSILLPEAPCPNCIAFRQVAQTFPPRRVFDLSVDPMISRDIEQIGRQERPAHPA